MYRFMFKFNVEPEDIAEFIQIRFSDKHVKVAMSHSSYEMETGC